MYCINAFQGFQGPFLPTSSLLWRSRPRQNMHINIPGELCPGEDASTASPSASYPVLVSNMLAVCAIGAVVSGALVFGAQPRQAAHES